MVGMEDDGARPRVECNLDGADGAEEAEDGLPRLFGHVVGQGVSRTRVKGVGVRAEDLPVVVEDDGVEGGRFVSADEWQPERLGCGDILVARLHDSDVWSEIAIHIIGCELNSPLIVSDRLKECSGYALGGLSLVVAGEHAVDVSIVHCPEAFLDIEGEGVDSGDDEDTQLGRDGILRLELREILNHL